MKIQQFEQAVSASYHDPSAQQNVDSQVFIDLNLFWEIMEFSFVNSEGPQTAKPYFGASLTSFRSTVHSEEVLRTRLLPRPTRIGADVPHRSEPTGSALDMLPPTSVSYSTNSVAGLLPPADETSISAQDYFALGQDFVGNLDDWWFPRQQI